MKVLRVIVAAAVVAVSAAACVGMSQQDKLASADKPLQTVPGTPEALIRSVVEARLQGGVTIDSITKTPYGGLYEVRVGEELFYADAKAEYVFVGSVLNAKTQENLTEARLNDLNRVDFKDLPLALAQKTVKGDGKRVMAVFADPNCGYCKRLEHELANIDNVTVYTFLFPVLGDDSVAKSRQIACSADRNLAWDDWMLRGQAPSGEGSCKNSIDAVVEYGRKIRVNGTPTIFFADGRRVPGAIPADQIQAFLNQATPGSHVAVADVVATPQQSVAQ